MSEEAAGKWSDLGWERSFLGYPVTDETPTPDGVGRYNHFQGGSIYWTPQTAAHEVHGLIRGKWSDLGWERSFLGYPVTDETPTPDGVGRYNHFQKGSIYWTPQTGAHEVHGLIRDKWSSLGWERSFLGYPISDEEAKPLGLRASRFQHGSITWTPQDGAIEHHRPVLSQETANTMISTLLHGPKTATSIALMEQAKSDSAAFVRENFELTPSQLGELSELPPQFVSQVGVSLGKVVQGSGQFVIQTKVVPAAELAALTASPAPSSPPPPPPPGGGTQGGGGGGGSAVTKGGSWTVGTKTVFDTTGKKSEEIDLSYTHSCFPSDTLVRTLGGWTEIGKLKVGDPVLGYDARTGTVTIRTVTRKHNYPAAALWQIRTSRSDQPLFVSNDHLFLTAIGWKNSTSLAPGDRLVAIDENLQTRNDVVISVTKTDRKEPVYNLYTTVDHTYLVSGFVVHNFTYFRRFLTWWHRHFTDPSYTAASTETTSPVTVAR